MFRDAAHQWNLGFRLRLILLLPLRAGDFLSDVDVLILEQHAARFGRAVRRGCANVNDYVRLRISIMRWLLRLPRFRPKGGNGWLLIAETCVGMGSRDWANTTFFRADVVLDV